jgi:hypothetical protein
MTLLTFSNGGITITESGVENVASGNAFLLYAEVLGNFSSGDAGAVQSILAVANTSSQEASVTIELNGLDGTRVDLTGTLSVPANGETVVFLNQLSGLESLPTPFRGMVRLSSTVPISLVGIRAQWNGRADLLLTSTVPANEEKPATTAELLIPFIVDGGGWSTQFVIFSSIASTSSSGALSFFDNLGAPLALKFR